MLPLLGLIVWWWGTTERPEGNDLARFLLDYYRSTFDADPGELNNILSAAPEVVARFRKLSDPYVEQWFGEGSVDAPEVSQKTLDRLRSLGYQ